MAKPGVEERAAFVDCLALLGTIVGAAIGITLLLGSRDSGMAFHGLLLVIACVATAVCVLEFSFDSKLEIAIGFMDGPIKVATIATVIWGIAGFVVGDVIAWQLALPALNLDLPWTSFGRLRPLHTSAVIFAFGGNVLIAPRSTLCSAPVMRVWPGAGRHGLPDLTYINRELNICRRAKSF